MMNNEKHCKTYLELANERARENKKAKADRLIVELAKIEAQNQRHSNNIKHKEREAHNKRIGGVVGTLVGVITFIILLAILIAFARIITQ